MIWHGMTGVVVVLLESSWVCLSQFGFSLDGVSELNSQLRAQDGPNNQHSSLERAMARIIAWQLAADADGYPSAHRYGGTWGLPPVWLRARALSQSDREDDVPARGCRKRQLENLLDDLPQCHRRQIDKSHHSSHTPVETKSRGEELSALAERAEQQLRSRSVTCAGA